MKPKVKSLEWVTVDEAAVITKLKRKRIYWLNKRGRFASAFKVGRDLRFDRQELFAWMNKQRESPNF